MPPKREKPKPTATCLMTVTAGERVLFGEECVVPVSEPGALPKVRDHAYAMAKMLRLTVMCPTLDSLSRDGVTWTMQAEDGSAAVLEYRCQTKKPTF